MVECIDKNKARQAPWMNKSWMKKDRQQGFDHGRMYRQNKVRQAPWMNKSWMKKDRQHGFDYGRMYK